MSCRELFLPHSVSPSEDVPEGGPVFPQLQPPPLLLAWLRHLIASSQASRVAGMAVHDPRRRDASCGIIPLLSMVQLTGVSHASWQCEGSSVWPPLRNLGKRDVITSV